MIKPTIKIEKKSLELLLKNAKRLPIKVREAVRMQTIRTAIQIQNDARLLVPVDTGRLRASLSYNYTGSGMPRGKTGGKVMPKTGRKSASPEDGVGQPPAGLKGFYAAVGTSVEYAEPVENRSPYLWPAVAMNRARHLAEMKKILQGALKT